MHSREKIMKLLRDYFEERENIVFACLFGSTARGKTRREGDIDIAIYFRPEKGVEWENFGKGYKGENRIALDLEIRKSWNQVFTFDVLKLVLLSNLLTVE